MGADTHNITPTSPEGMLLFATSYSGTLLHPQTKTLHLHTEDTPSPQRRFYTII
jgi:hypothetical protein